MADQPAPLDEHEYEDQLEPTHLIRRSHVVLRAGTLMLGAGTSALRVREVMAQVAAAVGVQQVDAQVTFTQIVLTVGRRGIFRTQVGEIRPSVNADRISLLHGFSHAPGVLLSNDTSTSDIYSMPRSVALPIVH